MLLLVLLVLILFALLLATRKSRTAAMLDKVPGPKCYPVIGNLLDLMAPREQFMQRIIDREKIYSPIYRTWLGPVPAVHISTPDNFEVVLSSNQHITKGLLYKFLHDWLGRGLLTSEGEKWHKHRKLITPTFHFKILDTFIDILSENSQVLVQKLEPKAIAGDAFDIYPFITLCALDIICETAMGTKVGAQNQSHSSYVTAIYRASHLIVRRCLKFWVHPNLIYYRTAEGREYKQHLTTLHGFTERVIKDRKLARMHRQCSVSHNDKDIGVKQRQAFLDLLLDASESSAGGGLSDNEIREEVDTFMFEGHDTTTAAMSWALMLLGLNQDVQEKAYMELQGIFGDDNRTPNMKDLTEMKYLERVIKETLRLYPSVPMISRLLEEDIILGEYEIPRGTTIAMHVYNLHRNPKIYPEPLKFDPDRFLPEISAKRHPYAYVPFSAGPRNCVGQKFALMEEKVVLSTVLRRYRISCKEERDKITLINELILRPATGIQVQLSLRG